MPHDWTTQYDDNELRQRAATARQTADEAERALRAREKRRIREQQEQLKSQLAELESQPWLERCGCEEPYGIGSDGKRRCCGKWPRGAGNAP